MLIPWLSQELERRQWDQRQLAQLAELDPAVVEATLADDLAADFHFCYGVARALEKQPERLLHMAGLLSDSGLMLAIQLANNQMSQNELYRLLPQVSVDERRLILRCAELSRNRSLAYQVIKPRPHEFNRKERRQDRIRFATIIVGLTLVMFVSTIVIGFICAR